VPDAVSRQAHDVILKYTCELLVGRSLAPLGVPTAPLLRALPTELPDVAVRSRSVDYLFELHDNSLLHLEFQTEPTDLLRFLHYASLLVQRYRRPVRTVVVYSPPVHSAPDRLSLGSLSFQVENVFLARFDGDAIRADLVARTALGAIPPEAPLLLALLPLMRHPRSRTPIEVARDAVRLAQAILRDPDTRERVVAALVGFVYRTLGPDEIPQLLEVVRVGAPRLVELLREEGWREGLETGRREGLETGRREGLEMGRREGLEAGRREGLVEALVTVLRTRFGALPGELEDALRAERDEDRLRRWLAAATTVPDLDAFRGLS